MSLTVLPLGSRSGLSLGYHHLVTLTTVTTAFEGRERSTDVQIRSQGFYIAGARRIGDNLALGVTAKLIEQEGERPVELVAPVDGETGDVLWYNSLAGESNVKSERALRKFVRAAGKHMLEPRNK